MRGRLYRLACFVGLLIGLSACSMLGAVEKHWVGHAADAIVVGRMQAAVTLPWLDGWHMGGTIVVDEVLFGGRLPRRIRLRFLCGWKNHCQWWPVPRYPEFTLRKGIWFLRRVDGDVWESPLGFPDLGFRPLESRGEWVDYIRRYKR